MVLSYTLYVYSFKIFDVKSQNDCKECNVHTNIDYFYRGLITDKRTLTAKTMSWDEACKEMR